MNKKNNQRYQETETRMEVAMLELMKHSEFEKITVKKICEKAKVNRSTFYAHFVDIFELLDKMEIYLGQELLDRYASEPPDNHRPFSEGSFIPFLQHIKKHSYFYKINLQHRKAYPIKQGFEPIWNIIKPRFVQAGITTDDEIMYYFIYFQAGFTMILKHWVDTGCQKQESEVAQIIQNCIPAIIQKN